MGLRERWLRMFSGGTGKLSKEALVSLCAHGCFQIGASMSALFLNLYLWRLTRDLWINGMFNVIVYGVTPFAFALGGWIAKKKDRMVTYRLGIGSIALFFLAVIAAGERVASFYPWFGLCYGTALGLYWTGYSVMLYDVTDAGSRGKYMAVNMIVFNTAGLIGPALSGYIIGMFEGLHGYIVTFALASSMFMAAALFSTKIGKLRSSHRAFYLRYSLRVMKKDRIWRRALFAFFFLGLFQGIMLFLPNILLYQAVGREDWVGLLTVLFSVFTIAMGFVVTRQKDRSRVRAELVLSSSFVCAGAGLLLLQVSAWSVISFMIVFSFFNPLTINTLTFYYYRRMDFLPLKGHFRIESVVLREAFLNAGRVLSILLLIVLADDPGSPALPVVLAAAALLQFGMAVLVQSGESPSRTARSQEKASGL